VFQHSDIESKGYCAASGGAFFRLSNNGIVRQRGQLVGMGHLLVDPSVAPAVLGYDMFATVQEAVDDRGTQLPAALKSKPQWDPTGQISFYLREQSGPASAVSTLTLIARVALCTKWIVLESGPLDAAEPIVVTDPAATVTIGPLRTVEAAGVKMWHVRVLVEWSDSASPDSSAQSEAQMHFETADGKQVHWSGMSRSGSQGKLDFDLRIAANAFSPAETRLVVRLPGTVEVVPVELHLKDVPILEPRGTASAK
jgi:hypothetical protein